jgi:hypothetical protein
VGRWRIVVNAFFLSNLSCGIRLSTNLWIIVWISVWIIFMTHQMPRNHGGALPDSQAVITPAVAASGGP